MTCSSPTAQVHVSNLGTGWRIEPLRYPSWAPTPTTDPCPYPSGNEALAEVYLALIDGIFSNSVQISAAAAQTRDQERYEKRRIRALVAEAKALDEAFAQLMTAAQDDDATDVQPRRSKLRYRLPR